MIPTLLLFTGKGACFGFLGSVMGGLEFDRWATFSGLHRSNLQRGALQRSVLIGGLASGILVLMPYLRGAGQADVRLDLTCIAASFVLSSLYVAVWLRLTIEFGARPIEVGELCLLAGVVALGLLCVCGILWVALAVIGGGALIAVATLGGLHIYRSR